MLTLNLLRRAQALPRWLALSDPLRPVAQAGHESVTGQAKNDIFFLQLTFMHPNEETVVSRDGLRFTSKTNGSPFQGMGYSGETLSCIRCSQHKPRRHGVFRRHPCGLFFICHDCKPPVKN